MTSEQIALTRELAALIADAVKTGVEVERERLAKHFETKQYGKDRYLFPDEIAAEIRDSV